MTPIAHAAEERAPPLLNCTPLTLKPHEQQHTHRSPDPHDDAAPALHHTAGVVAHRPWARTALRSPQQLRHNRNRQVHMSLGFLAASHGNASSLGTTCSTILYAHPHILGRQVHPITLHSTGAQREKQARHLSCLKSLCHCTTATAAAALPHMPTWLT